MGLRFCADLCDYSYQVCGGEPWISLLDSPRLTLLFPPYTSLFHLITAPTLPIIAVPLTHKSASPLPASSPQAAAAVCSWIPAQEDGDALSFNGTQLCIINTE